MNKLVYLFTTIFLVSGLILFPSCNRAKSNGPIDGNWMVESITYTDDGRTVHPELMFYSIQLELIQVRCQDIYPPMILTGEIAYDRKADKLVADFRQPTSMTADDRMKCGIPTNPVTFDVSASRNHLTLRTPSTIITMKRW